MDPAFQYLLIAMGTWLGLGAVVVLFGMWRMRVEERKKQEQSDSTHRPS